MRSKELDALNLKADTLTKTSEWWERESAKAMRECILLEQEDPDNLGALLKLEKRLAYLENKGRFESVERVKFEKELAQYFTKRMRECEQKINKKKKIDEE